MDAFQIQDHYCEVFLSSPNTSVKHVKNGGNYSTLKLWEIAYAIFLQIILIFRGKAWNANSTSPHWRMA